MHVEMRKVADIKPYPHNPRHNDHAVEAVYRRLADPAFRERLDEIRRETLVRTSGMLSGAALGAVKTLVDLQQDVSVPAAVRRGAARDLLEMNVKYRDATEIEQRVAAIEDRLADAG